VKDVREAQVALDLELGKAELAVVMIPVWVVRILPIRSATQLHALEKSLLMPL
jgi:hypothetical protein